MTPETPTITIERRFCGPAASGNGGWSAGSLAAHVHGVAVGDSTWIEVDPATFT